MSALKVRPGVYFLKSESALNEKRDSEEAAKTRREREKRRQDATARLKTQRKFHLDAETQSFFGGEKDCLILASVQYMWWGQKYGTKRVQRCKRVSCTTTR